MCEITLRAECGDFLTLRILHRSSPGCTDYWDGNWVQVDVIVSAGRFRGEVPGLLRTDELAAFAESLTELQSLRGRAKLETMEDWLSIHAEGDGRGHLRFRCRICDQPGIGNTLDCTLVTDQTFTRSTVTQLAQAVQAFPIVGQL